MSSPFGAVSPEEEPALRPRPADPRREVPLEGREHGVAPLAVDGPDPLHVAVEEAAAGHLVRDVLAERAGVEVRALLDLDELRTTSAGATIQPIRRPGASVFESVER